MQILQKSLGLVHQTMYGVCMECNQNANSVTFDGSHMAQSYI